MTGPSGISNRTMRILYVGPLSSPIQVSWQRCQALRQLGHEISELNEDHYTKPGFRRYLHRLDGKVFRAEEVARFNRDVLSRVAETKPQQVWLSKALMLEPETLQEIKRRHSGVLTVAYQDDNPFGHRRYEDKGWRGFIACIPFYDVHLVKRPGDVDEFTRRGAPRALVFTTGYCEDLFYPDPNPAWKQEVAFVGTQFDDRAVLLDELIRRQRLPVRVYGARWERTLLYWRKRSHFGGVIDSHDLRKLISSTAVMLNFVSKSNLDEYNGRSIDIPACRGFLLAERTPRHQELFQEGVEADFFGDIAEGADKICYYLRNPARRDQLAEAGYQRCLRSGYGMKERVRTILQAIEAGR